ncbi:phosphatidylglycerol lysyltransferase domain-containing protein [Bacillus sp. DTU_2020_1000418_1_SI_GHA_SEK_038]|uniref:phosphatidylglycerol lysyltransferase domain-containing protein n=1 Tax=Bacillus sp. DTU_2020_1000418_1_SI_GHA_SEK_038 TaxID=3077585 RepID=UPI003977352A
MLVTFKLSRKQNLQLACLPFGSGNPRKVTKVLVKCMRFCEQWNKREGGATWLRVLTGQQLAYIQESPLFEQHFRYRKLEGVDRHIGVKKVMELSGKEFKEIRENINRFKRDYPDVIFRRAKPEDYQALINLKQEWNQTLGKKYSRIWDDQFYKQIIENYQELDHLVFVAETGKQLIGMVTGGILPHGQAWGALSKRRDGYDGLSEYLNVEFTCEIHKMDPKVELINLGSDSSPNGGLRVYKNKFRPVYNSERYRLILKNE